MRRALPRRRPWPSQPRPAPRVRELEREPERDEPTWRPVGRGTIAESYEIARFLSDADELPLAHVHTLDLAQHVGAWLVRLHQLSRQGVA